MSELLTQVSRASVEERVWSFVADQRRRIPQYAVEGRYGDDVHNNVEVFRSPEAQAKINGSPVLHPRVPLYAKREEQPAGQENIRPDCFAEETRPFRSKTPMQKNAKIAVKSARIEDVGEHATRLTERRERRRAKREILKDKEIPQEECKSDVSDNKKRNNITARLKKATTLPAGLALMNSFSSKNVTKDRLTLHPNTRSAGMFSKGKASAKVKTRGIKPGSKGFDEHAFLNKTQHSLASSDDSAALLAGDARVAQTSRFFKEPERKHAEQLGLEEMQQIDNGDESAEDSNKADNETAGPVSEIWSIEREFLEDDATKDNQKTTPRYARTSSAPMNVKPDDDAQSVYTMNTQYRLGLPMCADIVATSCAAGPHPFAWPTTSAGQLWDDMSIKRPASRQTAAGEPPSMRTDPFNCHEHAEDSASRIQFCDHIPPDCIDPARAPSAPDDDQLSDHLLDDLDYMLACDSDTHAGREPQPSQMSVQDIDIDYAAANIWVPQDDHRLHYDDDALLGDPFDRASACGAQIDASFEQLPPDGSRVYWRPETEQFVTAMDDQPLSDGDGMFDDQDVDAGWEEQVEQVEQDHVFSMEDTGLDDEMLIEEELEGSESEEAVSSVHEAVVFTEGRSLLLGLCPRAQEQGLRFEWHPYRLG